MGFSFHRILDLMLSDCGQGVGQIFVSGSLAKLVLMLDVGPDHSERRVMYHARAVETMNRTMRYRYPRSHGLRNRSARQTRSPRWFLCKENSTIVHGSLLSV